MLLLLPILGPVRFTSTHVGLTHSKFEGGSQSVAGLSRSYLLLFVCGTICGPGHP